MKFPDQFRYCPNPLYTSLPGERFGAFRIPGREACGRMLAIIAVDGVETGWEHVSVSLPDSPQKRPSWDEMSRVKDLFWDAEECVVQFHPAKSEHINNHAGCLHLWRYVGGEFPTPPGILVGIKDLQLA